MTWTAAQRRQKRREYDRLYKAGPASGVRVTNPRTIIPDDVLTLDRDPAPCFNCGARDGCRHRPWMMLAS